jgi:predicted RNase H-like HicB family nuclease
MIHAYPVILSYAPDSTPYPYFVTIPDFDVNTQGSDIPHAIRMARDVICLSGIENEDNGILNPEPSPLSAVSSEPGDIVTFVDVDFAEYRRQNDMRAVRRNCSLPAWLDAEATRSRINVSAVLQNALKRELHLE